MGSGCESCNDQIEGVCDKFLNSDCIYISQELECSGVEKDTVLSAALKRLDEYICEVKNSVASNLSLINLGTGAKIYKGENQIGDRELRSIISSDESVIIEEGTDEIDIRVDIEIPEVPSATESVEGTARIATQVEVDNGTDDSTIVTPLKLATYVNENGDEYELVVTSDRIQLLKNGTIQDDFALPEGTDTYTNDFFLDGTDLVITRNDNTEFRQDLSSLLDFTQVQVNYTQENSSAVDYIKNRNSSKEVFANYTVQNSDNTYVIVIDSSSDVIITIPSTIPNKFTVGFIQKGTGLVTIANTDIIPEGFTNTIKGRGHQAFVEKIEGTTFLFGSLNKEA